MNKKQERFRKVLRTVFGCIGVSAASLIIQACYGPPPSRRGSAEYGTPYPPRTHIHGRVKANETDKPILGIKVSVDKVGSYAYTAEGGVFDLYVPAQEEYILRFKDIDGKDNSGLFKEITLTLNKDKTEDTLLVDMVEDIDINEG